MSRETCERLTSGKHTPERCLEAAFQFLLDREPKESILRRFDVMAISRYFPRVRAGDFTLPFAVLISSNKSLRRRAEQRDEVAAVAHSITSSAIASRVGGIGKRSTLAVFRAFSP
jgi:hypothetical protein